MMKVSRAPPRSLRGTPRMINLRMGLKVWGVGFGIWSSGFCVWGLELEFEGWCWRLGFVILSLGPRGLGHEVGLGV